MYNNYVWTIRNCCTSWYKLLSWHKVIHIVMICFFFFHFAQPCIQHILDGLAHMLTSDIHCTVTAMHSKNSASCISQSSKSNSCLAITETNRTASWLVIWLGPVLSCCRLARLHMTTVPPLTSHCTRTARICCISALLLHVVTADLCTQIFICNMSVTYIRL